MACKKCKEEILKDVEKLIENWGRNSYTIDGNCKACMKVQKDMKKYWEELKLSILRISNPQTKQGASVGKVYDSAHHIGVRPDKTVDNIKSKPQPKETK